MRVFSKSAAKNTTTERLFLLHHSSRTLEESEWSCPTISSCSRGFIARGDAHANEENVHKQLCMCISV